MKIIITGGAGYIGSWLVSELVLLGHEVVIIDHFSHISPTHPWLVANSKHVKVIQSGLETLDKNNKKILCGATWFFHCAGKGKIPRSYVDPVGYHQANVTSVVSALELARECGVNRFIYPMTSAGFYNPSRIPINEYEPITCPAPYTLTKLLGEHAVIHWSHVYGIGGTSLRLFHVYGPNSPLGVRAYSRVTSALEAKKDGKKWEVDGDGTYTQDLIYITDVCQAFIKAAQSNCFGETFQIATGVETSIIQLAKLVGVQIASNGHEYKSPYRGVADIHKAVKKLHWKPEVDLASGLKKIIHAQQDQNLS